MTTPPPEPSPGPVARGLLALVGGYRVWISPLLAPRCRFLPTCSEYGAVALGRHGAARGSLLIARRLLRCHPFHPGGYEPVPPRRSSAPPNSSGAAPC